MPRAGRFVTVCAERPGPDEEALPRIEQSLRTRDVPSVWRLGGAYQVGIVALRPRFPAAALAREIGRVARAQAGLSAEFTRRNCCSRS